MSFEIQWEGLQNDVELNAQIRDKLNSFFSTLELPSYLNDISITDFKFGSHAPEIILHDISEPISGLNPDLFGSSDNDLQLLFEVKYDDDLLLELNTSLVLNYPSKDFMALPINIKVKFISLHILCLIGIFNNGKRIIFSVLCDIEDENDSIEGRRRSIGELMKDKMGSPLERLAIIKNLNIETEIGADTVTNSYHDFQINDDDTISELSYSSNPNGTTLRNVDRLEQFLVEKLKNFLRQEVGWPSWLTFEIDDESDDDDDENDSGSDTAD